MHKTSFEQLSSSINNCLYKSDNKFILIHSDITTLGKYMPKNETIIDDINEIISDKTILIPAYTIQNFTKNYLYNPLKDRSEVGVLGELARRNNWERTNNPMHSMFVNNNLSIKYHLEFKPKLETSSFGENSLLAFLQNNITIIQIGCFHNTYVHRAEEIFGVDYRFKKEFKGEWQLKNNKGYICNEMLVRKRNLIGIEEKDRLHAAELFFSTDSVHVENINNCKIKSFTANNYLDFTLNQLKKDRNFLTAIT